MRRGRTFSVVYALMLFDFIDRQVLVSMFPHLKAEWQLSDVQLGSLATVVSLAIGAGAIPIALLVRRWNRVRVLGVMGSAWSIVTALGALATGFWQLFASRLVVGIAQAGYAPVAGTLLADLFPSRSRSTALGALLSTALLGSVLGVYFGGILAARYGWRAGLAMAGGLSLLPALVMLAARDSGSAAAAIPADDGDPGRLPVLSRALLLIYAGFTALSMVAGTVVAWLPSYFNRSYGLSVDLAGMQASVVMVSSACGTLLLGWLTDRWVASTEHRRLLAATAYAMASCVLLTTAFSLEPGPFQVWLLAAAGFLMLGHLGPVLAVVMSVSDPRHRSTSFAILVAAQNLLGVAGGPLLAGWLSDRFGLGIALQCVSALGALGAAAFAWAAISRRGTGPRRILTA